jgi:membrane protein YdbS with pleckstrin-like domain
MFIPFEEGEILVLKVHRHWWFIALRVVGLSLFAFAPLAAYVVLRGLDVVVLESGPMGLIVLTTLWALVLWALFWQFWTTYYMDIWVVTNRRIIDIDYQRLFDRNIAILRLDRVQDVTTHVSGILPTLLRYGSVVVQTAGSDKQFVIDQIAHPETLRDTISKMAGQVADKMRTVKLEQ